MRYGPWRNPSLATPHGSPEPAEVSDATLPKAQPNAERSECRIMP